MTSGGEPVTVIKLDEHGRETWRYSARLLEQGNGYLILEAFFDREDTDLHGMPLRHGDRFIETWYTDRWYNIFEIRDPATGELRGWYCNVGRPAQFETGRLSYVDLALDLLVFPDGRQIVLDEDEFAALSLSDQERGQAHQALNELQNRFRKM
jgi:hypothetical protein